VGRPHWSSKAPARIARTFHLLLKEDYSTACDPLSVGSASTKGVVAPQPQKALRCGGTARVAGGWVGGGKSSAFRSHIVNIHADDGQGMVLSTAVGRKHKALTLRAHRLNQLRWSGALLLLIPVQSTTWKPCRERDGV